MPLCIGSPSHGFVDVPSHRISGIGYLVSLFLSYPMSLSIWKLAHWQGICFRITEDHGISYHDGSRWLVVIRDQVLLATCLALDSLLSFGSVLLLFRRRDISPGSP